MTTREKIINFLEVPHAPHLPELLTNAFSKERAGQLLTLAKKHYSAIAQYALIFALSFTGIILLASPQSAEQKIAGVAEAAIEIEPTVELQGSALVLHQSLLALSCDHNLTTHDLRGSTLKPGVYCINRDFRHQQTLTLDARGDENARFVIQIRGRYLANPGSELLLINKASPEHVYLVSTDSITISANSLSAGNLVAQNNVFLGIGTRHTGQALSVDGRVRDHSFLSD